MDKAEIDLNKFTLPQLSYFSAYLYCASLKKLDFRAFPELKSLRISSKGNPEFFS